ncbi:MAG: hypothetical protein WCF06_02410, partial [Nitrososphaeraceae archaeon]
QETDMNDLSEFCEDSKMILHSNCTGMECSPQDRTYDISLYPIIIQSLSIYHSNSTGFKVESDYSQPSRLDLS